MIDDIKEKWNDILNFIKDEYDLTDISYKTWLLPLEPYSCEDNILTIVVPDELFANYISKKYERLLRFAIAEITGFEGDFVLVTENDIKNREAKTSGLIDQKSSQISPLDSQRANLNPKYTFENFVVGKSNEFAHAASLAVAETPGEIYNPLFIYGGVGLGKTHLMQAIAHFILKNNPEARVLYVTSEDFTNELIESIRNKNSSSTAEFREKYRNNDVLLIDDIQFIVGKESTQEEFFHTFNALYEAKKQIIITSDRPPKDFETLEDRLRSRFEWGLAVDIQKPDFETRVAILREKEKNEGYNLDDEVIKYIASNIKSNIRELEGALTTVNAYSKLHHTSDIDITAAEDALKDIISPDEPREVTCELIIDVVAEHYGLSPLDIIGEKRNQELSYPRQIIMYLCYQMTGETLQNIGKSLGNRDHSTVKHGIDKIKDDLENPQKKDTLQNTIDILKKKINPPA